MNFIKTKFFLNWLKFVFIIFSFSFFSNFHSQCISFSETSYDVSKGNYNGDLERKDISTEETTPTSLTFNNEGTKMFVLGLIGDYIYEYSLSTAFDVSTATYTGDSERFNILAQDGSPTSLAFNNDGTKMFMLGRAKDFVNQYSLSTPFDVSTGIYDGDLERKDISSEESSPSSLAFNFNGTKMFVMGQSGKDVNQYSLSTPFDISAAIYDGDSERYNFSTEESSPQSLAFNNEGTKMFVLGSSGDDINQYTLSVPFDVSTASYDGDSERFIISGEDGLPRSLAFNNNGDKFFFIGDIADQIFEYSIPTINTSCLNTPLSNIIYSITGATGISNNGVAGANNLPGGVSATFLANTITISGTPTAAGTFNYSIPLTGGCGSLAATGVLTVNALPTITGVFSACEGSTTQLTGSGTPGATPWLSSNVGVATVSNTGLVTGISSGTTNITYTNNNSCQKVETLTVNALPTITVNSESICAGSAAATLQLQLRVDTD